MPTLSMTDLRRIAIFRALNLGDLLCAIPAVRALRAACSDADITMIGLPGMAGLARRFSRYFTSFVSFPGAPGLPEQSFDCAALCRFLQREKDVHYDLLLQMHGKGSVTNPLISLLSATRYAGFYEQGEYCPDPELFMPYPDDVPEVRRHLRLMEHLGVKAKGEALEFPLNDHEWMSFNALAAAYGFDKTNFICIHPGARDKRRWWSSAKFAQIADALAGKGNTIVFTGTASETGIVAAVRDQMKQRSIDLAGKTDLGVLAALIGRARLLVSNDTGVSHIAAAMGTPSVVIFLASDPMRWAPLDRETHHAIHPDSAHDIDSVLFHAERALQFSALATTS